MNTAAVCEIQLQSGRICGVSAIGRCTTCERAFCPSHQVCTSSSISSDGWFLPFPVPVYLNMCAACFATSPAELSRIKAEENRARYEQEQEGKKRKQLAPYIEAQDYFVSGAARAALSRFPTVAVYKTKTSLKKGFFGSRLVETIVPVQHGWCIGELRWYYSERIHGEDVGSTGTFLTVMIDREVVNAFDNPFVRVQPYSDGYKDIGNNTGHVNEWIDAAKAVKQLCGTP
jgi:hypothetical protein